MSISRDVFMDILNAYPTNQTKYNAIAYVNSYASLKKRAESMDFETELSHLKNIFRINSRDEAIKASFRERCRQRELNNQASFLSFTANPENECNKLYWLIAEMLFEPQNLQEMIEIILPSVKSMISVELKVQKGKKEPIITLKRESNLNELNENQKINYSDLANYIIVDGMIFNVKSIINLSFSLHQQFHDLIKIMHPPIYQMLYQWNSDFEKLSQDMILINNKGLKPKQALDRLCKKLRIHGSAYSGNQFVGNSVYAACNEFQDYLKGLPSSLREKVLKLSAGLYSVDTILNQHIIKDGGCVESAASHFDSIMNLAGNQTTLNELPHLTKDQLDSIMNPYGRSKELIATGRDRTVAVSNRWKTLILPSIRVEFNDTNLIALLATLPTQEYETFLEYITFNTTLDNCTRVKQAFINKLYTSEQMHAFFKAVLKFPKKYGDFATVLSFASQCNYDFSEFLKPQLENLKKDELSQHLTTLDSIVNSGNINSIFLALSYLSLKDRLTYINRERDGKNLIEHLIQNKNIRFNGIQNLAPYIPEKDLLALLNTSATSKHGFEKSSPLYSKIISNSNPDSRALPIIFESYPSTQLLLNKFYDSKFTSSRDRFNFTKYRLANLLNHIEIYEANPSLNEKARDIYRTINTLVNDVAYHPTLPFNINDLNNIIHQTITGLSNPTKFDAKAYHDLAVKIGGQSSWGKKLASHMLTFLQIVSFLSFFIFLFWLVLNPLMLSDAALLFLSFASGLAYTPVPLLMVKLGDKKRTLDNESKEKPYATAFKLFNQEMKLIQSNKPFVKPSEAMAKP